MILFSDHDEKFTDRRIRLPRPPPRYPPDFNLPIPEPNQDEYHRRNMNA
jgi:hypothetical protein